jgi:hypothetical protein
MMELEESPGLYRLSISELQIAFFRSGDRWRHALAIGGKTGWQTLFSSVEGTPDLALPPSPAFQDLRQEKIAEGVGEFQLFGQAGQGVYSAAIRVDEKSRTIAFDVAARSLREGAGLCFQSTYETASGAIGSAAPNAGGLAFRGTLGGVILCPVAPALAEPEAAAAGANQVIRVAAGSLAVTGANHSPSPRNARWQYEIRLAPGP